MNAHMELNSTYPKEKDSPSKCELCSKVFHNRYVRDFHVNNLHYMGYMGLFYTCYICRSKSEADEFEVYHKDVYSLFRHKDVFHEENNTTLHLYIDISRIILECQNKP